METSRRVPPIGGAEPDGDRAGTQSRRVAHPVERHGRSSVIWVLGMRKTPVKIDSKGMAMGLHVRLHARQEVENTAWGPKELSDESCDAGQAHDPGHQRSCHAHPVHFAFCDLRFALCTLTVHREWFFSLRLLLRFALSSWNLPFTLAELE